MFQFSAQPMYFGHNWHPYADRLTLVRSQFAPIKRKSVVNGLRRSPSLPLAAQWERVCHELDGLADQVRVQACLFQCVSQQAMGGGVVTGSVLPVSLKWRQLAGVFTQ